MAFFKRHGSNPEADNGGLWFGGALIVAALVFAAAYGFKQWDQNTSRSAETGSNNHPSSSSSTTANEPAPGTVRSQ